MAENNAPDDQVEAAFKPPALAHALRDELSQLRAATPSAGRNLNIAALIRDDRDGR